MFVIAGDDEGDENGEEGGMAPTPSCFDYVMHFLTLFWKILFAFIPPTGKITITIKIKIKMHIK